MSEQSGGYFGVRIFAIVLAGLGWLSFFQWGPGNLIEQILAIVSWLFCLGLVVKQKWALVGIYLTLLVAVFVFFTEAWFLPIVNEDTALVRPNVIKLIVGILLFIYIGRERVENRLA